MSLVANKCTFVLPSDPRRSLRFDFSIKLGECAVVLGRNGSGKSTFFDVLCGFRPKLSGEITQPSGPIGYAVQDASSGLFPWQTALENILLPAQLKGFEIEAATNSAKALLDRFHLGNRASAFPYELSGGEKQIVNLIRALLTPGALLLLDEPFAALNSGNRSIAHQVVGEYAHARITLIITHEIADLTMATEQFLLLNDDQLVGIHYEEARSFLEGE